MSVYNFQVETIKGEKQSMSEYQGDVLLIVNTATKCGFARQFESLQELHDRYKDRGFAVLGFPCGQFANQEPGHDAEIEQACQLNFGVSFPLFSKIDVKGPQADPLFEYLTNEARGILGSKAIKWNFTKFLVDRSGKVIRRFAPADDPARIAPHIEKLLEQRPGSPVHS
ncbi:glutathione peroxidase [Paenibacillus senegalensis]|uniref:glutathione peroxidase n=1 Tax=Paenibacillus senegalensis TaxID=1465766 RepID=UPI0002887727|nr:glutathione peroxidase [Paenibacillus senegalensis]